MACEWKTPRAMLSFNSLGSQDTAYALQNTSEDNLLDKLPPRPEPIYTGRARDGSGYVTESVSPLPARNA